MTVSQWLSHAESRLKAQGFESARLEAQVLAGHVLLVDRSWLLAHGDELFPDLAGETVLQRREAHEPLAYIVGWREFWGRRFAVNRHVLIPRHETETLIEAALSRPKTSIRVLDIGTGSGILAITLKLERANWDVWAVDISSQALEVAKQNADDLGANVTFVESDLVKAINGQTYDLIVTNPPYIGREEPLDKEVTDYEPHLALFAENSGLAFYRRLATEAKSVIREGGTMLMEVGYRQSQSVSDLFQQSGWTVVAVHRDMSGVERVVEVRPNRV